MKGPTPPLYRLLDIISKEEVTLRRGPMISAMAVHKPPHKKDDKRIEPGDTFYTLAQELFPTRLSATASPKAKHKFWQAERRAVVKWARSQPE